MAILVAAVCLIVVLKSEINAEITSDTIEQFNIGQLFAFYETDGPPKLCKSPVQFAVAKKSGTGDCQWKIADDFAPEAINQEADLPVKDANGNCYFACVYRTGRPRLHTEKVINRKMVTENIDRKQFDLYTYLAPCSRCINGPDAGGETAELDEFNAVYYSSKPEAEATVGSEVKNDALLLKDTEKGLSAIKETTKVNLNNVKSAVDDGKAANKGKQEIINDGADKYEKNAIKSYLDQNPLN